MDIKDQLLARIAELHEQNRALERALEMLRTPADPHRPAMRARAIERVSARIARLESVFEWLPVGMAIAYGPDCARMKANAALLAMLGVHAKRNISKSASGGSRLPFRVFRNGVEAPPGDLPMQKCAREGIPIYGGQCEIHRADGRIVILESVVQPWGAADSKQHGSIGAFFDATDRHAELERLKQALAGTPPPGKILRICAACRRIADADNWETVEAFLAREWQARFTHGLCPDCFERAMNSLSGAEPER